MKMYQLHQIPAVVQCVDYKTKEMVNKPTHDSGTIIDHMIVDISHSNYTNTGRLFSPKQNNF